LYTYCFNNPISYDDPSGHDVGPKTTSSQNQYKEDAKVVKAVQIAKTVSKVTGVSVAKTIVVAVKTVATVTKPVLAPSPVITKATIPQVQTPTVQSLITQGSKLSNIVSPNYKDSTMSKADNGPQLKPYTKADIDQQNSSKLVSVVPIYSTINNVAIALTNVDLCGVYHDDGEKQDAKIMAFTDVAFAGLTAAAISDLNVAKTAATISKSVKTDFYIKPSGDVIPSTGYRYMPSKAKYIDNLKTTMEIPENPAGTYITFDKFDVPNPGKLQVPHDASIRGSFDTLQIIDDIRIPNGKWGDASWLEPITKDFPKYGTGGATQAVTNSSIKLDTLQELLK
jgi:hypothetical protein